MIPHFLILGPYHRPDEGASLNDLLHRLVAALPTNEREPLACSVSLATLWQGLLCLTGDLQPQIGITPLSPAGRRVTEACHALLTEMAAEELPDPLNQPLTLGLLWYDLCRTAGEAAPPAVAALLDAPATC